MVPVDALPTAPLTRADVAEIRAREDVTSFIVLGTTSIRARSSENAPVTAAVALLDGVVCALEFDGTRWSQEVLRRDADRQDHVETTLQWSAE